MAMEVMPANKMEFDFNRSHLSAPSSPKKFGEFYSSSAPTSPTHLAQFYRDFDDFLLSSSGGGENSRSTENDGDFAFDIGEESSETAEELFHGGVIKPLKPSYVTRASTEVASAGSSAAAERRRGRERTPASQAAGLASSSRRATRSLSPLRGSDQKNPWEQEEKKHQNTKSQRKWRLKDFFLFRSASEGRAADKDPLRKYYTAGMRRSYEFDGKKPSSNDSRRRGKVSAHEMHYTANRAAAEDLKKKTFLPYKQGILGRLSFNPAAHALANGFGFSRK